MASGKALIAAFQTANPGITVKIDTRPGGSEGDNLMKTRLSTGDMADVFIYNNGSLLQAIKPAQNLTPLDDQPWASQIDKIFAASPAPSTASSTAVRRDGVRRRGALQHPGLQEAQPQGPEDVGPVHEEQRHHQEGRGSHPVEQTYGETWTSQLFVLGDYHNVEAQVPDFAAQYTAGKAKYATTPAAQAGFQHIQEVKDAGYFNKDFASAKLNDGLKAVATGKAAQYPQLGGTAATIENVAPG